MLDWRAPRARAAGATLVAAAALAGGLAWWSPVGPTPRPAAASLPDDARPAAAWFPGFSVGFGDLTLAQPPSLLAGGTLRVATASADLELRRVGAEEWELRVHAKREAIEVWFPWRTRASSLDLASPRTVVLYPMLLGVAARAPSARSLGFDARTYPGECFAPLVVLSNARTAEIVAATNWPPRSVTPTFAADGLGMRYSPGVPAGETRTFRALVARREGDELRGDAPWLRAALAYRSWLLPHLEEAGLRPLRTPAWLAEIEGWQNVQLQNLPAFEARVLEERWRRWKHLLPWMQLWGQMSDYVGGAPASLRAARGVGCCLDRTSVHERYGADFAAALGRIAAEGHVGLYARPRSPYRPLLGGGAAADERRFLLDWLVHNRDLQRANAFYVDVLGHRDFGEPLEVARFVRDALPEATVVEYAVDLYPRPALVSGSLGGGSFGGGPGREPREIGGLAAERTTFPRFGRAILADLPIFLGESNGDHELWGAASGHWAERQAFLLGAKLDVMRPFAAYDRPDEPNDAVRRIVELRTGAGWWRRRPVYLDRAGITGVPDGVDVRRFRGSAGEHLLVADNWQRRGSVSFRLDGREVALSAEPLSIRILESGA